MTKELRARDLRKGMRLLLDDRVRLVTFVRRHRRYPGHIQLQLADPQSPAGVLELAPHGAATFEVQS